MNKIEIDLDNFSGRSVIELKSHIAEILSKLEITYKVPRPGAQDRTLSFSPYESFDLKDGRNHEIITTIKIKD